MPRKPTLRRTPTGSLVAEGGGILRLVPPERVAKLAERHGVDREALAGLVKRVIPRWASDEQSWRTAYDPALPEFQAAAAKLLAAWEALPLATRSTIFRTLEHRRPDLVGRQHSLEWFLAALPGAMEIPRFWRPLPPGRARGLPPHTRATVRELAAFWKEQTRGSAAPRWLERTGRTEHTRGSRFVAELTEDVTGLEITPDQLHDLLRDRGGAHVPKSK